MAKKFYNPSAKSRKYANDLKAGYDTSTGQILSGPKYGFRIGYLAARSDNAKAYKAKMAKNK